MAEKMRCKVTDTKQEILRQYKAHLEELNAKSTLAVPSTDEVAKKAKVEKAVTVAVGTEAKTVEDLAVKLNRSITDSLMEISQKIAQEKARFDELVTAINAKKDELKQVLQIEVEANSLAAIIASQNKAKEDANEEINSILQEAEAKAKEILQKAEEQSKATQALISSMREEENKRRVRDAEEYNYTFERTKKEKMNDLNDQLAAMAKSLDARTANLEEREAIAADLESQITSLNKALEDLKADQEKLIANAVDKAKKDAEKSAAISASIVSSKHESALALKDSELKNLIMQVTDLKAATMNAQAALASAQKQVQEVAMQALSAKAEAARPIVVNETQKR